MGSVYSIPTVLSALFIAGGIAYGFLEKRPPPPDWASPSNRAALPDQVQPAPAETKSKKKKKGSAKEGGVQSTPQTEVEPTVVQFPAVVPGSFEQAADKAPAASATVSKPKKKKKAKKLADSAAQAVLDAQSDSSATAPESSTPVPRPTATRRKSTPIVDADGPWTRVESKKRSTPQQLSAAAASSAAPEPAASEVTTSVTGTSSPVNERKEDERSLGTADGRRTLAERLLPKPRKTHVEEYVPIP